MYILDFICNVKILSLQPNISDGKVVYGDSALVRAVRNGYVLVVDEADKAPTHVTSVLRTLLDTRSMWLSGDLISKLYSTGRCQFAFYGSVIYEK